MDVEPIRALYSDAWFRKILGDEIFDAIINYDGNNEMSLSFLTLEVKKNVVLLAAAKGVREILEIPDLQSITSRQDCVDSFQRSALHYAAYHGHLHVLTFLLDHLHLNYNHFLDSLGHNAFHYACEGGDLQTVDFLVMKRNQEQLLRGESEIEDDSEIVQTDSKGDRRRNNKDSIKLGLRKYVTEGDVFVAIVLAARKGNIKVVLRLLNEYKGMLFQLEEGIGTHCNSLFHLLGRSISAQDLRKLKECGLEVDFTTKNTNGVKVLEHISPNTIKKFLDLSVSSKEENIDKNITESYCLKNPFLKRFHSANCNLDMITILELAKSECHQHLIFHPIFFGICSIKWQYIRKYYFAMLFLFIAFASIISLMTVIKIENSYTSYNNDTVFVSEKKSINYVEIWQIIFAIILFLFGLLEMVSLITSNFIINVIRYLLWFLSIIIIIVILSICSHIFIQETSFFIILIPWLICIKHIGHHYILSKYYSNFIEISKTCIKIFCVFGPLIIAFTLIFHIMMIKNEPNIEQSIFQYFHTSGLKIINMMIGDLTIDDFSNKFTNIQWNFTFSIFTIIIAFILYNMTNALAVSDTERLIKEADIYKIVSMTKQILLFQNILNNLALIFNINSIFIPNIIDFNINCNNYQWKIEKYTYEDLCCRAHQSSSQDYVDMRDTVKYFKSCNNMFMIIDFKIGNQLRDITLLNNDA